MSNGVLRVITEIIKWSFSLFISLFYYKNGIQKIKKIISFYKTMSEYKFFKEGFFLKIFSGVLIGLDFFICMTVLFTRYRIIACIVGIILQSFYITILLMHYNMQFENNCGCFSFNSPRHVDFRGLSSSFLFLFLFASLLFLSAG